LARGLAQLQQAGGDRRGRTQQALNISPLIQLTALDAATGFQTLKCLSCSTQVAI
jgi:hypothetical protein